LISAKAAEFSKTPNHVEAAILAHVLPSKLLR